MLLSVPIPTAASDYPSLAKKPKSLTGNPPSIADGAGDLLSDALRRIRITSSMQYCYMPSGEWITDATPAAYKPADAIGFHIMAGGSCWLEIGGVRTTLEKGDIAAFPFGTPHWIGVGTGGRLIDPGGDLPPAPWREIPILRYGNLEDQVRILCGYIQCEAMNFGPFRNLLPEFIHVPTLRGGRADWLAATIEQIVAEVDAPRSGGASVLERLTEVTFIEVLRREFLRDDHAAAGWLAAVRDPALGRCLASMHAEPWRSWTIDALARSAGLSRSALSERFAATLGISPIRYLRDWRLYLASVELRLSDDPIVNIALDAGYASEASFNRAFARHFGAPPAEWRRAGRAR
jgi:AraC-like DNA-binding protein